MHTSPEFSARSCVDDTEVSPSIASAQLHSILLLNEINLDHLIID